MAKKEKTNKSSDSLLLKALHGRLLSTEFFRKHWWQVLLLMAMILIYITNRYNCQTRIEILETLNEELIITHTEYIKERGTYMSNTRETAMQHLVDSLQLNLKIQNQPPYHISVKQ
ncbi:MAG: FtsL-like putative cell division protein [Muribaculaceae bacterium]|nr:FtsL-like putative cell division protein [Muribaculaceae bacterium]